MKKENMNVEQTMTNTVDSSNMSNIKFSHIKLLSLKQIVGDAKKGIDGILPFSRSTWFAGIKEGRFPQPIHISKRRVAWKYTDIVNMAYSFPGYGEAA